MGSSTIVRRAELARPETKEAPRAQEERRSAVRVFAAFFACATALVLGTVAGRELARDPRSCAASSAIAWAPARPESLPRAPCSVPAPPLSTALPTPADLPNAPPLARRPRPAPAAPPSSADDRVLSDSARR
ncbi:MAG TPA: hypothetical protein VLT33_06520 [Labilithrix sp.]|nr:hypothetical protein [Labilithrix sp.]